ncbi:MAG TPA: hypothetical protein VKY65_14355 [Alphaproteobacteria bacterium]|nr:hypothetical protein [Alphaproteobacteria bacterium]
MRTLFAALAALPLLAVASLASAQEPLVLSNGQMDTVTAGSASGILVTLTAIATGGSTAATETAALAQITQAPVVFVTPFGPVTLSAGTTLVQAASTSAN